MGWKITLGCAIFALGFDLFLEPNSLNVGGMSGLAMILRELLGFGSIGVLTMLLNVPLFLYGLKRQGVQFTVYALYTVFIYSLGAWLITDVLPVDVSLASPLAGTDLLLCALFGGIISGIGSGLAIRYGGAMDGVEVMAVIFAKRLGITVGTFVMIFSFI